MKHLNVISILAAALLMLSACKPSPEKNKDADKSNKVTVDSLKAITQENVQLKFHDSYSFDNGCIIVPVILKEIYFEKGESEKSYSNILFIKPDQSVKKLDSLHHFFIERIHIFESDAGDERGYASGYEVSSVSEKSILTNYLLLKLKASDYKTDSDNLSKTKYKSNFILATVKTDGTGFKYLSPLNADLKNFFFNANSGLILTQFAFDTNSNEEWDEKDELQISTTLLGTDSKTIPVIDSSMRKQLLMEYETKLRTE